jgi:ABC-2 type transport system ATP-binding protein
MCDSLLFINQGRIIHHGSAESLRRGSSATSLIEVQLAGSIETLSEWASLSPHVTFREATKSGGRIEIDSVEPDVVASVLRRMVNEGLPVIDFHLQERKLEDAFIEILGEIEASGTPIVS